MKYDTSEFLRCANNKGPYKAHTINQYIIEYCRKLGKLDKKADSSKNDR